MEDLIKALGIFLKYRNESHPTHCEHDTLWVVGDYSDMSDADKKELDELGFFFNENDDSWQSYKYGSA